VIDANDKKGLEACLAKLAAAQKFHLFLARECLVSAYRVTTALFLTSPESAESSLSAETLRARSLDWAK
jgi:hypothetical protein